MNLGERVITFTGVMMSSSSSEWYRVEIGQLGKVVTGNTPSTKRPEFYGDQYPFITPSDLDFGSRTVQTERFLSERGKEKLSSRLLPADAVCFTSIGATIGKMCMTTRQSFTNQQINSVIVDKPQHDPRFVYYLLRHNTEQIKMLAGGAATPIVSKSKFAQAEVVVPHLPTQRKIAAILSAYDDLIENNTRRVAALEEMARLLYREWFVHFRFPGHEQVVMVDSELGPIPERWEVRPIGKMIEILGGGTPSTKKPEYWEGGEITWYTPSDLTSAGTMFIHDSSRKITALGLKKSSAKMFLPYSVMMTSRATVGVVAINTGPACTNQGFITCVPNEKLSAYYLYFWIIENREQIITLASGATFKEINKTTFRELPVVIPDRETQEHFLEIVEPIGRQIENLLARRGNLRYTRDLLLPRLISGEVDVSDMAIDTGGIER
ncbi:MAG: restriction endonuclease subunit S [Anaerolineae bacterium]|nr:restriction endonuclease subunit S [Anaerolineae bacterium]